MSTLHILIYVCSHQEDIFAGIRKNLNDSVDQRHECIDIYLEEEEYKYITNVEFTFRKYTRFLYYGKIFKKIEKSIRDVLRNHPGKQSVVFYLADEGVWAQLIRNLIERIVGPKTSLLVNVQHGLDHMERPKLVWLRRIFNLIAKKSFGYPIFGYGFGSGVCDLYLVYGDQEVEFLARNSAALGIPCPELIKYDLIKQHNRVKDLFTVEQDLILLALPPGRADVRDQGWSCSLPEYLETISPVVKWIKENYGQRILARPHPGVRDEATIELIRRSPIGPFVEIDLEEKLMPVLARSAVVIASGSTVLFDAYCLGKVPIALDSYCFDDLLPFPHEVVEVHSNFTEVLRKVLSPKSREHYRLNTLGPRLKWNEEIEKLIKHHGEGATKSKRE